MQLTNIIRDVAEDLDRDRIYLPLEDLERFGLTESDLHPRTFDDRFRELVRFEVARARDYFSRSEALFPCIVRESRYCPVLLKRLYESILDRIETSNYDVLARRVRLPLHEKLRLVAKAWLTSRRGARPRGSAAP